MKIVCVIPARYQSTRFPGKPLAEIEGKPMIWWVYNQCKKVDFFDDIYVATDSVVIQKSCQKLGINCILTSDKHLTGTDRVGEVAQKLSADLFVNVQGDEPLIAPEMISACVEPFFKNSELQITNLMAKINDPVDIVNPTIPKVITNKDGFGIYLTRATAPFPKGCLTYSYYKQVCVYCYRPKALEFFYEYGKKYGKSKNEEIEDVEILRFIENGYKVLFVEVESNSLAVDTKNDLERVRQIFKERNHNFKG